MRAHVTLPLLLTASLFACGGTDPAPSADVIETTPLELQAGRDDADDLHILVAYADGDGDLGGGVAEVHDCRAEGLVASLPLPNIASEVAVEEGVPIQGNIDLVLADVGIVATDAELPAQCAELGVEPLVADQVVFCVRLVDVGGESGDGDCTEAVTITE